MCRPTRWSCASATRAARRQRQLGSPDGETRKVTGSNLSRKARTRLGSVAVKGNGCGGLRPAFVVRFRAAPCRGRRAWDGIDDGRSPAGETGREPSKTPEKGRVRDRFRRRVAAIGGAREARAQARPTRTTPQRASQTLEGRHAIRIAGSRRDLATSSRLCTTCRGACHDGRLLAPGDRAFAADRAARAQEPSGGLEAALRPRRARPVRVPSLAARWAYASSSSRRTHRRGTPNRVGPGSPRGGTAR